MTKEETIKIMAMLGAFYGGGKTDPEAQATAWHLVIGKYNYKDASEAILRYAENDVRDYGTFPTVGCVVNEIRKIIAEKEKPVKEIIHRINTGLDYYGLSSNAKMLIEEPQYNEWSRIDAEVFANKSDDYADILRRRQEGNNASNVIGGVMKRIGESIEQ